MAQARERWGTKMGVILAVAGSAVGLGISFVFLSRRLKTAAALS